MIENHPSTAASAATEASQPVKLYWWRDRANFGDALSAGVVEHVLKRKVEWSKEASCDLFAIGSILHRANNIRSRSDRPLVWGSGFTKAPSEEGTACVEILAVRGPLTASRLNLRHVAMGDPGLFASDLIEDPPVPRKKIGILIHFLQKPNFKNMKDSADPAISYIDPATSNYLSVIRQIARCEMVLSSSLHGLIVADSLGIPNHWIDPFDIADMGRTKFYDYALAIGRDLGRPIELESLRNASAELLNTPLPPIAYKNRIQEVKAELKEALLSSSLAR